MIPLWKFAESSLREWLTAHCPSFADCAIARFGRYLGVYLGPEAGDHSWDGLVTALLARATDARNAGSGLSLKLRAFSAYCVSLVAFRLDRIS